MTLGLGDVDYGYICAGCHLFIQYSQCHNCEGFDQGSASPYCPPLFGKENEMETTHELVNVSDGPWVEWIGGCVGLPEESGRYHVFYKIPYHDYLVECIIEWDNEKQVWNVPPSWNSEDVWYWSPTYRSRKIT